MEGIINEVMQRRDEVASELNDIWNEIWEMADDKNDQLLKIEEHFHTALRHKTIKEMLIYIKELLYYMKKDRQG